jgi:hypothetical protein
MDAGGAEGDGACEVAGCCAAAMRTIPTANPHIHATSNLRKRMSTSPERMRDRTFDVPWSNGYATRRIDGADGS